MTTNNALILLVSIVVAAPAAAGDWYPSRYGADDTLGAINNLSPEKVVEAARLVKQGKVYALGVEIGSDSPTYPRVAIR